MKLESLLQYLDGYLGTAEHPDHPNACNGLQVEGTKDVRHVAAAVDASEASIRAAVDRNADLLIVHHGLFWNGSVPLSGRLRRRITPLIASGTALYSAHLPLDGHVEVGNNVLLCRAIGVEPEARFDDFQGVGLGWYGSLDVPLDLEGLVRRVGDAVSGAARAVPGGPPSIARVGVVTGAGAGALPEAAALGLDALVTGECAHHHFFDAMELGVHLVLGGHYATETFGVQALAEHVAERFDLEWSFVDQPTGF
ncbi:MAG: Nif3-like dinuclear metal center hexameric protein [Gemmatimonadales bacterium]